jgi:hypothetical protein
MQYKEVLQHFAPCGLDCARCADFENGEIKQISSRLACLLGNYGRLAKMKENKNPIFRVSHYLHGQNLPQGKRC